MHLEIVTPDTSVFEGEVSLVQLPGLDGSFEILNNHAPMIAVLKKGQVKIETMAKETKFFDVNGGVLEIVNNKAVVLAE
mgnify:CR=1 FL=1